MAAPARRGSGTGRAPRPPGSATRARVDPQLLREGRPCPAQRRQGVRLPLGAVEREHQEPPPLLAQGVVDDQGLELADQHGGVAQLQTRRQQALAGQRTQLGEPDDLGLDPRLAGVLGVRRSPPQAERVVQGADGVGGRQGRGGVHGPFEGPGVHALRTEPEDVAGPGARDHAVAASCAHLRLETTAQVADVGLDRPRRVGRRRLAPDAVGEPVGRDDLAAPDDQGGEHGTLAPPAEVDDHTVTGGRQLAEHTQAQPRLAVHLSPGSTPSRISTNSRWTMAEMGDIAALAAPLRGPDATEPRRRGVGTALSRGAVQFKR